MRGATGHWGIGTEEKWRENPAKMELKPVRIRDS